MQNSARTCNISRRVSGIFLKLARIFNVVFCELLDARRGAVSESKLETLQRFFVCGEFESLVREKSNILS